MPAEGGAARRSAARRRWACGMEAGGSRPREARSRRGGRRLAEVGARQPCLLSLKDVKVEDDKTQGPFCIYSCPLKGYGPKWHNLTSSGSQISILRVRGPKWHLGTSSRAAGVFNSFIYHIVNETGSLTTSIYCLYSVVCLLQFSKTINTFYPYDYTYL